MNRAFKWVGGAVLAIIGLAVLAIAGVRFLLPRVPLDPTFQVQATPEKLARGKYLVENVSACVDCHSKRDWGHYAGPVVAGTEGQGGERFGPEGGLPGTFHAPNITPAGLGEWTDAEIARAIVSGVTRGGEALFPIMPYKSYQHLTRDDLEAVVAHLRTLPKIDNAVPPRQMTFPMSVIVRLMPGPWTAPSAADPKDKVAHGGYLTKVAGCADCHTPKDHGKPIPGKELAGGFAFVLPDGTVRSANITPDPETGIGSWSEEIFVARFKAHAGEAGRTMPVPAGKKNTVMPWSVYAGMTPEDLGAIHAYLKTVPAVKNRVEN